LFVRHVDVLAITDLLVCLSGFATGRPTASAFTAASPLALSPPPATTPEAAPDAPEDTTEAERQQQVEEEEKEQERVAEAAAAAKAKEESDVAAAWRTTHAFPTPRTTPSRCSRRR
jgi:pyruvate/2-oxoglutarate dehydrogenase complex dihydrolipoamide acyltransferase (E2) component